MNPELGMEGKGACVVGGDSEPESVEVWDLGSGVGET